VGPTDLAYFRREVMEAWGAFLGEYAADARARSRRVSRG